MTTFAWAGFFVFATGFFLVRARGIRRAADQLAAAPATDTREVLGSTTVAGTGAPRALVELTGRVEPGEGGPLRSPLTGTECVWFHARVAARYRRKVDTGEGTARRRGREVVVRDESSRAPFLLRDAEGAIPVVPSGRVSEAPQVLAELQPPDGREVTRGRYFRRLLAENAGFEVFLGHQCEEWVLPVGSPLLVVGEAVAEGRVEVREPADGREMVLDARGRDAIAQHHREGILVHRVLATISALIAGGLALWGVLG
ncbi:E3 ubiquitin ligase family protein [Nocardioides rotundus]|uniref:E3 ubiquitin ligase family protein n=1 Tax=Nocardioides rotundus TaxID=1774216 RepID=UPI001CBFFD54|nr:E3 ubiquitin ligase family protein [Nocardioides rotundus]UAL29127.1 E3 ubiquitin ligase family protein [Nocardioides rotundus]